MKKKPSGKFVWAVKIGEKGQLVIPKKARDIFGFEAGDTVILFGDVKKGLAIPPKSAMEKMNAMFMSVFEDNDLEEEE